MVNNGGILSQVREVIDFGLRSFCWTFRTKKCNSLNDGINLSASGTWQLALTPSRASLPKFSARSRLLLQRDFLAATTKAPPIMRCSALQQPNISLCLYFSIGLIRLFSGFSLFVNCLVLLETCLAFHYKSSRPPPTLTAITQEPSNCYCNHSI
jgi:hypothetical protein